MLGVRVASALEGSTMGNTMGNMFENCLHLEGLRVLARSEFRCPICEERLDIAGIARWVRAAERARDEAYSMIEGDEFSRIAREERQREVYRRRKVLYELQSAPRAATARPEMILVVYDPRQDSYECRIFYKEPRPPGGTELVGVGAVEDEILDLCSHADPNVRLAAGKVEEFHTLRSKASDDEPAPMRRVYYANEL